MKLKTRYQIFISSTFIDLVEERQKVIETILKMKQFPIGMELFHADDTKQWKQIKQAIDDSDFYILILAHRYGSITSRNISYTEKEYNYAKSKKKQIYSFIIDNDAPVISKNIDKGKNLIKLEKFKKKVMKYQCAFWKNKDELSLEVSHALRSAIEDYNKLGWIKIDNNISLDGSDGIESYFYTVLSRMKKVLSDGTYIESFNRYIDLEFIDNDKLKVYTLTEILFKNVKNIKYYYMPQPVFESKEERDSYRHIIFEINGNNELKNITINKIDRSMSRQLPYVAENKINYDAYEDEKDVYIRHKTEYIKQNDNFFQFYQLKYPCKRLTVHCTLFNKTSEYKFICSASSSYIPTNMAHKSEIGNDGVRSEIVFGEWSDIGDGFTVTLGKK